MVSVRAVLWGMFTVFSLATAGVQAADWPGMKVCKKCIRPTEEDRLEYLRKAGALSPLPPPDRSLLQGPSGKLSFKFNEEVRCRFREPDFQDPPNGKTAKFWCDYERDGKVTTLKVKYQTHSEYNDGVFGEILSTRLFWALGFPADRIYPVKLICENCPPRPWGYYRAALNREFKSRPNCDYSTTPAVHTHAEVEAFPQEVRKCYEERLALYAPRVPEMVIEDAVVEFKFDATAIESQPDQGWSWDEFDVAPVDPQKKVERDALALLAAFVQHADNKAEQQRLICLESRGVGPQRECLRTQLMIQDVGFTFGAGHQAVAEDAPREERYRARILGTASVEGFRSAPLWSEPENCVTHLQYYTFTGMPARKPISEAGRALLAERFASLSRDDVRDLFTAARIERRGETRSTDGGVRPISVSDWETAFMDKVNVLRNHRCPQ